ncbi:MAG TPA: MFS transporter [Candidatus Limnocylindrales bacterium]|nr:MFS transporter [Candidatus Limnocylindrales bacterium]
MTSARVADWRPGFLAQMAVAGLAVTTIHATRPTITYRALDLGATPVEIGLIQSSFSLLPALLAIAIGRRVDRDGASRYMIGAMAMLTAGGVLAAFAGGLPALALAQLAMGLGQITYLVAGQALVANVGPREGREVRFGHYSTINSIGQLIGPIIPATIIGGAVAASAGLLVAGTSTTPPAAAPGAAAGIAPDHPEGVVFLVAAGLTASGFLLALLLPRLTRGRDRPASPPADGRGPGLLAVTGRVLRRSGMPSAMFVGITVISTIDLLAAYLPAHGEEAGLSVGLIGALLSARAGASLVSRIFMAQLIARLGRSRLLGTSMAFASAAIVALPFVSSPPVLVGLMVVVGLGIGLGQPMTIAWVANRSPRSERGTALGVRITGNRVALLVVPTLMGAVAGAAGIAAIFVVVGVALAVGAGVAFRTPFDAPIDGAGGPAEPASVA